RKPSRLRQRLDGGFEWFKERCFRPLVSWSVRHAWRTLCLALACLLLSVGLLAGKRVLFNFFPSPEATVVVANVAFVAGTPPARVERFLQRVETALYEAESSVGEPVIDIAITTRKTLASLDGSLPRTSDQFGNVTVQLLDPDKRSVRNPAIIQAWRSRIELPPGIENFSIIERRGGPPGRDVDVRLIGDDAERLKQAALELARSLESIDGVSGISDDMPYGRQQLIYRLTPQARALGLTTDSVGRQLRAAYDGRIAQIFQDGDDELEVRVMLPDSERFTLSSLERFNIVLPDAGATEGGTVPLMSVVEIDARRGFEILKHTNGQLSLQVSADVDGSVTNNNDVIARIQSSILPSLVSRYAISYTFEGRRADQTETLGDMQRGLVFALIMIYLVLAWVFASWTRPLVVMAVIPFGLVGAIWGHWHWEVPMSMFTVVGLLGMTGIIIND
ncbi:MAG: efflux RND transporter permease subunit, partial [Gammaproteobacteria bacterium]|nr:efflux RND transporter permease subunit [Gammaproteobacteria bacterium]